ncbi:hypothetical protein HCU01_28490 [Halomonas cupida]|uniref:Uncharacterized protein n=1 Tax=Halomonas cupida TaxID=44933 RepID=A0ABQ0WGN5_9GAMM|nr:hypothetical protein HCU01_28490 [Halomonas cupida]
MHGHSDPHLIPRGREYAAHPVCATTSGDVIRHRVIQRPDSANESVRKEKSGTGIGQNRSPPECSSRPGHYICA